MSAPVVGCTQEDVDASLSVELSPGLSALGGPLGPTGPSMNGMLSLQDATEVCAQMRAEHGARLRAEADERREDYRRSRDDHRAQLRRR